MSYRLQMKNKFEEFHLEFQTGVRHSSEKRHQGSHGLRECSLCFFLHHHAACNTTEQNIYLQRLEYTIYIEGNSSDRYQFVHKSYPVFHEVL